jgi:hypothetical protein
MDPAVGVHYPLQNISQQDGWFSNGDGWLVEGDGWLNQGDRWLNKGGVCVELVGSYGSGCLLRQHYGFESRHFSIIRKRDILKRSVSRHLSKIILNN